MDMPISSSYKNFFYYWFPVIAYCGLIFFQSSRPVPEALPAIPHLDKLLHVTAYAFLSILFFRAFMTTRLKDTPKGPLFLSILCAGLYGISDELHQHFVPYRSAEVLDVLADIIGSVIGSVTVSVLSKSHLLAD
jgi:VanZ family protein